MHGSPTYHSRRLSKHTSVCAEAIHLSTSVSNKEVCHYTLYTIDRARNESIAAKIYLSRMPLELL